MQPPDLPPLADVIVRLGGLLDRLRAPYAIGGAVAVSFWGVPHTTQDADCLVAVPAIAYQRLAYALNNLRYLRHWSDRMLEAPAARELDESIATSGVDPPPPAGS